MKMNDILCDINSNINVTEEETEQHYYLPWVEKYRPINFNEIVDHKYILQALNNLIKNKNIPHLLFYGPPGTGKTSTILACAKKLYGDNYKNMILELNGSDDRGINIVREQIKDFSSSQQFIKSDGNLHSNLKLIILDEADSMTYDAQFALRRVIENYTSTTRFCLICNYQTKILSSLLSRCMVFKFKPIVYSIHKNKLLEIIKLESNGLIIDNKIIDFIIELSEGDMRKSLNLLQAIITCNDGKLKIYINDLYKLIGHPSAEEKLIIPKYIFDTSINLNECLIKLNKSKIELNISTCDIIKELLNYIIVNLNSEIFTSVIIEDLFIILSDYELKLQGNTSEYVQLVGLISSIKAIFY